MIQRLKHIGINVNPKCRLRAVQLYEKDTLTKVFPVKFAEFPRTPFFTEQLQ